jgi:hypothetical protein
MRSIVLVALATSVAHAGDNDALCARLRQEHDRARTWNIGWGVGLGVAAVAQAGVAPLLGNHEERDTLYVGAVESAIGAASSLVTPLSVDAPDPLCRDVDDDTLARAGRRERNAFYLNHVGGLLVNLGGALILAHYTTTGNAALAFGVGYAVSLVRTYTAPRWAWHPTIAAFHPQSVLIGVATSF